MRTGDDALIFELLALADQQRVAFPTRFEVTEEGTRTWLHKGLLDVPGRMLFLVVDRFGHPSAISAFQPATVTADGGGRRRPRDEERAPGLMSTAMTALLAWAEELFRTDVDRAARLQRRRPRGRVLPAAGLRRPPSDALRARQDGAREI